MGMQNAKGMKMVSTIMTCMMTWSKHGLDTTEMLLKALGQA